MYTEFYLLSEDRSRVFFQKKMSLRKDKLFGICVIFTLLLVVAYELFTSEPLSFHWQSEYSSEFVKYTYFQNTPVLEYTYLRNKTTAAENESVWWTRINETIDRISVPIWLRTFLNKYSRVNTTKQKLIYHVPHENYGSPQPQGQHVFKDCPVNACGITRKRRNVRKADAVYLEGFHTSMLKKLLPKSTNQVWVVIGGESPPLNSRLSIFDSHGLGNLINWTAFYRRDSTIPIPYGQFETFPNFTRIEDYPLDDRVNYAAGRTKHVAWFVSNCDVGVHSGRGNYAAELSKYIDVDIYGHCGKLKCPRNQMGECLQMLRKEYKFYLAFENNCCKDYITEKFFSSALQNDVIPIALGAHPDDYKALAPPGSYIHVDDFESPKQLADYLHLLDKNDTLYNEYFRWKKTGTFFSESHWCRLCALLHANNDRSYVHWYPNFYKWWEEGVCLEIPKSGQWQSWRNKR